MGCMRCQRILCPLGMPRLKRAHRRVLHGFFLRHYSCKVNLKGFFVPKKEGEKIVVRAA
jgi:hypothetical protein